MISVEYQVTIADVKTGTAAAPSASKSAPSTRCGWRTVRDQEAALAGLTVNEDEPVFAAPDGSLTHPD